MVAEEPRRSGRATKGQHTKIQEDPSATPTKAKGKGKKKQAQEEEQQEEEEEDEQVRCLCGTGEDEDEGGRAFTCCDSCNVWQHNDCMGLPIRNFQPEKYYCEQCRPEDHPQIIEALKSGQAPEDIATQNREEAHSRKKGGRKSKGSRPSEAKEEATPTVTTPDQSKRKHTSETPSIQPSKLRKASTHANDDVSAAVKSSDAQSLDNIKLTENIFEIKNSGRQNTAQALKKKFAQVIREHSSKGSYRVPDGHTPDSLGEQQALVVEYSMHMNLCGNSMDPTPAYKEQFRNITSNIGPNPSLIFELVNGGLTADALSKMSSSEMASEEQKKRDKEIKEENERLAMIKEDESSRRRIRKTHKGDEYIDDEPVDGANNTSFAPPPPRRIDSSDIEAASPGAEQPRAPRISTDRPTLGGQEPPLSPRAHRRSSSNFNVQNVWSSVHSPTGDGPTFSRYKEQPPVNQQGRVQSRQNDADIDRLLEDDEGPESAPYSPTDAGADPSVIWRGKVDMPSQPHSIACFDARAYHVAGSNLENREKLVSVFPKDIALGGRIAADRADGYLNSLSAASRTDVTVLDLVPSANDAKAQAEFNKLFDYLLMRQRYGVVKEPHNPPVRDVYIIPLESGNVAKPMFLQRLVQNVVEDNRSRRMLLVVFVLRYRSPAPSAQATPTTIQAPISALSPTAPGGPMPLQQDTPVRAPAQPNVPNTTASNTTLNGQLPLQQPHQQSAGTQPQPPSLPDNPYTPSTVAQQVYPPTQQPSMPSPPPAALGGNQTAVPSQPTSHLPGSETIAHARSTLGQYFDCPTAQQLLKSMGNVNTDTWVQLRRVFENHPNTRTDFVAFQQALSKGAAGP